MSAIAYRAEIDGLRAVAVLSVVLYHFGVTSMSGGFVGVDVFFVISGYLITAILQREFVAGRFSIADFYRRRALRILPALFFLLAILCVLMPILFTPSDIVAFGRSLPAVAAFLSNFHFGREVNYFDTAADTQILLHTWSLAVEEQFYILYPLALGLAFRFARRFVVPLIWLAVLVSFALAVGLLATNQAKIAFYMFPPRAWELGLGAVVALGGVLTVAHRTARDLLTLAGLGLIGFSLFTLDAASVFPGLNALPSCLGAALVIAYGADTRLGAVLGSRAPRLIGKISYSLYLWHWPVAVVARQWLGEDLGLGGLALCLIVSGALATLSYRFVETPFRAKHWTLGPARKVLTASVVALLAAGAAGPILIRLAPESLLLRSPQTRADLAYLDYDRRADSRAAVSRDVCFLTDQSPVNRLDTTVCLKENLDRPNVLVFGDSHLAYLLPGLRETFPDVNFVQATAAGCTPVEAYTRGMPYCRPMLDTIYARLEDHPYKAVILGARWSEAEIPDLIRSIARLKAAGQTVIVLGPALEYSDALPAVLARGAWSGRSAAHFLRQDRRELDRTMRDAVAMTGVVYVSQQDPLCDQASCQVRTTTGAPIAFDYAHYTTEGALWAASRLRETDPALREALQSP